MGILKPCGVPTADKLAAISTDGQYHHGGVPGRFLKRLRDSEEDIAQQSKKPCVPCLWDDAHRLQLADGDARKGDGCQWVRETVDTITRINKKFAHGKAHESFRDTSEALGGEGKGILLWSDTRFAPHAAKVLKAFIANLPAFKANMEEQLVSDDVKSSVLAEALQDIKLMKG